MGDVIFQTKFTYVDIEIIHVFFSCINTCRVSKKLSENETARQSNQILLPGDAIKKAPMRLNSLVCVCVVFIK